MSDGDYPSRAPSLSVILTKFTVRVGECQELVTITCPRFLPLSFLNTSHFPRRMRLLFSTTYYSQICARTQADADFFLFAFLMKEKACDEISLKSSRYLRSELSLSGSAAHYLIARRNSLMQPVEIGLPDAVHMKKKLRRGEEEESVAINITSLSRVFKIL